MFHLVKLTADRTMTNNNDNSLADANKIYQQSQSFLSKKFQLFFFFMHINPIFLKRKPIPTTSNHEIKGIILSKNNPHEKRKSKNFLRSEIGC
jgi:hypothetical protein